MDKQNNDGHQPKEIKLRHQTSNNDNQNNEVSDIATTHDEVNETENDDLSNPSGKYHEGEVAKEIEDKTAKIPSDVFLWASFGSMGVSLGLKIMKQNKLALFVGQWAAPFMIFGIYNKIVKTKGSE